MATTNCIYEPGTYQTLRSLISEQQIKCKGRGEVFTSGVSKPQITSFSSPLSPFFGLIDQVGGGK